ncbi:Carbon catabolite repressor protein 4-like 1 [Holothuria leucospilota]|uniref:Carbon catabolite repressor protein 4-like 1 n=1 Tax=Holothuria leucospilota TaxID=206669 RepID=A0A9Q1H7S2_HOLLE|nr:Carbon catabolite repressor protein 4-like 1 [Holothuria leucospilota]
MDLKAHIRRRWVESSIKSASPSFADCFGVVSYNILADCHWNPSDFPYCPEGSRLMKDRHKQLMVELQHDINTTDVICLQEVGPEYFVEQLQPALLKLGFFGSYFKKQHGTQEGEATFYRTQRFHLLEERHVTCTQLIKEAFLEAGLSKDEIQRLHGHVDKDNVAIYSKLYDTVTGKTLFIGNFHSTFSDYKAIDVTTLQITATFQGLCKFAGGVNQPVILCGDFNQEPHMPGYLVLQDGGPGEESIQYLRRYHVKEQNSQDMKRKPTYLIDMARPCFQHSCPSLKSAYKEMKGCEPTFTNYEDIYGIVWHSNDKQSTSTVKKNACGIYATDPEKYGTQFFKATLDYQWLLGFMLITLRSLITVTELNCSENYTIFAQTARSDRWC